MQEQTITIFECLLKRKPMARFRQVVVSDMGNTRSVIRDYFTDQALMTFYSDNTVVADGSVIGFIHRVEPPPGSHQDAMLSFTKAKTSKLKMEKAEVTFSYPEDRFLLEELIFKAWFKAKGYFNVYPYYQYAES